ncbi:Neutral ceramidase [Eufriesea mexicana]|uniref:Neutral ceramidase n=1 Tax=Eufriesea mexicana TaxID=516756 RepID=A0A310SPG7_9HYME|nr:Neutral ceramidase [Eufriesea mexicana]
MVRQRERVIKEEYLFLEAFYERASKGILLTPFVIINSHKVEFLHFKEFLFHSDSRILGSNITQTFKNPLVDNYRLVPIYQAEYVSQIICPRGSYSRALQCTSSALCSPAVSPLSLGHRCDATHCLRAAFQYNTRLWQDGKRREVIGPLRVVHRYVNMVEQTAEYYNETTQKTETVHGCEPAMGYSFAAGTIDGPGSFSFKQGTTTANPMWNAVRNLLAAPTSEDIKCHGAKPILLATGHMNLPYEWQPKIVSTQVALIGNVVIAGVPGEFTTMSGRRLREAIKRVMNDASDDETSVIIAGLCNTYSDYVTTPEEYQLQRYEGASTIFGPHTLTIYLKQYQELTTAAILKKDIEPGPTPPDLRRENLLSFVTPVLYDTPKWNKNFGDCIKQPQKYARPGDIVTAVFVSGHPRNNLMTESSFLTIEKLAEDEVWIPVANDASWETKFEWQRTSVILGASQVIITWQVPEDIKDGEYRIRHNGYYRYILGGVFPYYGVSNHFQSPHQKKKQRLPLLHPQTPFDIIPKEKFAKISNSSLLNAKLTSQVIHFEVQRRPNLKKTLESQLCPRRNQIEESNYALYTESMLFHSERDLPLLHRYFPDLTANCKQKELGNLNSVQLKLSESQIRQPRSQQSSSVSSSQATGQHAVENWEN